MPEGTVFPEGFDSVPRRAAIDAIEEAGIEVLSCFSGWGGKLSEIQSGIVDDRVKINAMNSQ